jgi:acetyltransferase
MTTGCFAAVDGGTIEIRTVAPADREGVQAFVRALAPETRRRRFFSAVQELPKAMLDALVHPAPAREKVLVAAARDAAAPRFVGLAQYAAAEADGDCEIAVVVADDAQGQGLGARMVALLVEAARKAGFRRMVGDVLPGNRPMLTLARRAGFEVGTNPVDPDLTRIVRPLCGSAASA